jgi:hypothetical protein
MLNGIYPTKKDIKQAVAGLTREKLTDFAPWNLIVQGNNIALIDQSDKEWREVDIQKSLEWINAAIDQLSVCDILNVLDLTKKRKSRKPKRNWLSRLIWKCKD